MKKILLIGLLIIIAILCLTYFINDSNKSSKENNSTNSVNIIENNANTDTDTDTNIDNNANGLLNYEEYKSIRPDNIKNIEVVRLTIGGANSEIIKEETDIIKIYNILNKKRIGERSNIYTTDNTTLYTFTLKDDTKITIEIEADCVVIKDERYVLE